MHHIRPTNVSEFHISNPSPALSWIVSQVPQVCTHLCNSLSLDVDVFGKLKF